MKMTWLYWTVATIVCWGCYVPMLHAGQKLLGGGKPPAGGLRAFLCLGGAYFLVAVVIPVILLYFAGMEDTDFSGEKQRAGAVYATIGGVLGAAGALGIILAFKAGGTPLYIPSLVFAGAPIVNVLVTMAFFQPKDSPKPGGLFYVGIILAAVGASLVLYGFQSAKSDGPPPATAASDAIAGPIQAG